MEPNIKNLFLKMQRANIDYFMLYLLYLYILMQLYEPLTSLNIIFSSHKAQNSISDTDCIELIIFHKNIKYEII